MAEGTVFVVDDDRAVRRSLELLFSSVDTPVRVFSCAQEFLDGYREDQPGCLVLDVRMPGMSGLELQRHLKEKGVDMPVIFITGHGDVPMAVRAMKDGAVELLEKPFSAEVLLDHVQTALQKDAARRRLAQQRSEIFARLDTLSEREREVMDLVVAGRLSKQIALELGISKKTVDVHRARVMQKMQVNSLPELVEAAIAARGSRP